MVWKTSKLGEVCELIKRGIGPKYIEEHGVSVVNQKCVRDHSINYDLARRHDVAAKKVNEERYIKVGDVLVNSTGTGTLGRVAQVRAAPSEPTTVDTHVTIVRPLSGLFYDDFFGYMLIKIEEEITSAGEGASGQTELARSKLENEFSVSYPSSLEEQKRIVAILDQTFADIDKARANAEQNLKNTRELFESYLQQVFSQRGESTQTVELGTIVEVLTDYHANGSYKVLKENVELKEEKDFAWMVRSTDFEKKFKNDKRYISEDAYNYLTKSKLFGGEIIMSKIGNAGKVYFMPETAGACSLAMNLFLIRLDSSKANNEYVYRYLNSNSGKAQIAPKLKGAATQTITKDNVRSLLIPLPPLSKQKEKIQSLKKLEKEIEGLEEVYLKKLQKIEELKKSILQKAFSGKLTRTINKPESNLIPFPTKLANIGTTDLHAGILALAYQAHEQAAKQQQFGHVKAEKIAHLTEAMLGIELDRTPIQDAAGPNDYPHFKKKVEPRAKKAGFFSFKGSKETGYLEPFENMMQLLVKMDTAKAEIFATVYAAWNNLLLDNADITDEAIVQAARENWHDSKLKIPRERFFNAIAWMREENIVPLGRGKYVHANGERQ